MDVEMDSLHVKRIDIQGQVARSASDKEVESTVDQAPCGRSGGSRP
jgi:hypothetical protein